MKVVLLTLMLASGDVQFAYFTSWADCQEARNNLERQSRGSVGTCSSIR